MRVVRANGGEDAEVLVRVYDGVVGVGVWALVEDRVVGTCTLLVQETVPSTDLTIF